LTILEIKTLINQGKLTIGGGGGNRTRVQRRNFRHSPGAATILSSQPLRISWPVATLGSSHKKMSIAWSWPPRAVSFRSDAEHQEGSSPGSTDSGLLLI